MKFEMVALIAVLAALVVAGCGGSDEKTSTSLGNSTDRAFVAGMIPHHKSAVEMAKIAQQRGQSQFVKTLAGNIVRTQTAEIGKMQSEDSKLADDGLKKGSLGMSTHEMGMSMDIGMLKTASPFDSAFLKMMLPHHKGAVAMAQMELDKGKDTKLKALAKDIISAQTKEIAGMNAQLAKR